MRQGTNNRRSRGRGGGGGGGGHGGGGRKQPAGRFQSFDSNGPNGRLRGNASQLYEKYQNLGRDAVANDRIFAENLLQHAEHYYRIMNAAAAAAAGNTQPRPRANGEDAQPVVDRTQQPDQPVTPMPAPVTEASPAPEPAPAPEASPVSEPAPAPEASPVSEPAPAPEASPVSEPAPAPEPEEPKKKAAPTKAAAKPRKRRATRKVAAEGTGEDAAKPADDDRKIAS